MRLTEEHRQIQKTVRDFVQKELNPHCDEWEEAGIAPLREILPKMAKLGLLGIDKPEKYGGMGLDFSYQTVANEALGYVDSGGISMAINVVTSMATPALARFGSEALCQEFLVPTIAGERVCSIAVSEVTGGSDVASLRTTARKDGDDYIINGSKMWITNGSQADWYCVLVNTSDDKPHVNKTLVIVPASAPGITTSAKIDKLGMRSSDTVEVYFDEVRIPQRYRIGEEGQGFMLQMIQFQEERLSCIASVPGMDIAIQRTIEYTRERNAFGQPLINNQAIHFRLAELQTEVEALRALYYKATEDYINGEDVTKLASMCKLKTGRLLREVSDSCLQYWGGMGFTWDNPISRMYRDTRIISIAGGADEVMLGIISKYMGILPGRKKN